MPDVHFDESTTQGEFFAWALERLRLELDARTPHSITDVLERLAAAEGEVARLTARLEAEQGARERVEGTIAGLIERVEAERKTRERSEEALRNLQARVETRVDLGEVLGELGNVRRELLNRHRMAEPSVESGRSPKARPMSLPDAFYQRLEARFRGDRAHVTHLQEVYLDDLRPCVTAEHPLVDLGAGRGEFVDLCRKEGLAAIGIDSNREAVESAVRRGLDLRLGDLFTWLENAPDASCGALSLMHVVEHFPAAEVLALVHQCRRVLVQGGVLIMESPNPENVRVGAGTFWLDPTHIAPIHPQLLEFFAQEAGFGEVQIRRLHAVGDPPDLGGLDEAVRDVVYRAWLALDGPQDYAVVARA